MNIKNKTVLITGGNSGIGFAIAKLLRSQGSPAGIFFRHLTKIINL
jgi:NAD(P)-dependent dehydrogenase (short-subunit alcohol dehydrogenase family)